MDAFVRALFLYLFRGPVAASRPDYVSHTHDLLRGLDHSGPAHGLQRSNGDRDQSLDPGILLRLLAWIFLRATERRFPGSWGEPGCRGYHPLRCWGARRLPNGAPFRDLGNPEH